MCLIGHQWITEWFACVHEYRWNVEKICYITIIDRTLKKVSGVTLLPYPSRCLILQLDIPPSVVIPSFLPHQRTKAQLFYNSLKIHYSGLLRVDGNCFKIFCFQQNQYSECKQCNLSLYYLSSSLQQLPKQLVWYHYANITTRINISPDWDSGSWCTCKENENKH